VHEQLAEGAQVLGFLLGVEHSDARLHEPGAQLDDGRLRGADSWKNIDSPLKPRPVSTP